MSVPFSNTHLRVPRGFGTILEGLTREILRDQPEDIPKFAAQYFDALLKQREDSGVDPAEWTAKLEDRFYNNHAFKATGACPEKEPGTKATTSKEKSYESQTEDESSHSTEASNLSPTQPNVPQEVDLTQSSGDEEEKHDITEKHIILLEDELSEEQSVSRLPVADAQPDELSGTEEERDPTINTFDHNDRPSNGKDSSSVPDQHVPQSELDPTNLLSFRGISNVDICAQELGITDHEGGDKKEAAVVDRDISVSEGEDKNETEEPVEVSPYSELADVDVHATEPIGTERTVERPSAEDDMNVIEEKSSKPQPKETVIQSSSLSEIPEDSQQELEDQSEKTKEEGTEIEMSSEGIHRSLTHIDGSLDRSVLQKADSLVEVDFEDVPEAQQVKEVEEKQPEVEDSVEVSQTNMVQMQQEEQFSQVTAVATDQNISAAQDYKEPETDVFEKEINSQEEEKESQHESSDIIKEKVGTHDSNLNDSEDEEKVDSVKTISSSHQPTSKADEENPEYESDHKNEDDGKIGEGELHQNESNNPDFKEDETEDTTGGDEEDIHKEGYSEVEDRDIDSSGTKTPLSQITQSSILTPAMKAKSETFEPSEQHLPEEDEEGQGVQSQQENAGVDKEVTTMEGSLEAEGLVEERNIDSEIQEKSDVMCDTGSISPTQSADWLAADHEERPPECEEDTTEPEGYSVDKQEDCSRPQEEEDIMDIPLDDPEANRAAAKIQAGFRGHMTRKKMKPEDKAEGEEVSSTGDVLNCSQGDTETGGSGAVERDDTSVPEQ